MSVKIYTGTIYWYKGSDKYDITVKTGDKIFAPSWDMVKGYKSETISNKEYIKLYSRLMVKSYNDHRHVWESILNMNEITFCCYCRPGDFCHRVLLAKYFEKLGATYKGERQL